MDSTSGDDKDVYIYLMSIAIAHEIVHFFTCFLNGGDKPITPPNVTIPGWKEAGLHGGEAGRAWELAALGGIMEFYASPDCRLEIDQPGVPYLFENNLDKAGGQQVSMSYVRDYARTGGTSKHC